MNIGGHDIGVCSWSFRANTVAEAVAGVKSLGLGHMQLALSPLVMLDDKRKQQQIDDLRASGLAVTAGMFGFPGEDYSSIPSIRQTGGFVPDAQWPDRMRHSAEVAKLAKELGISLVTTHIGFVPHKGAANYQAILDRARWRIFSGHWV
jgi:sugar phosphate isomerase/epimerase